MDELRLSKVVLDGKASQSSVSITMFLAFSSLLTAVLSIIL